MVSEPVCSDSDRVRSVEVSRRKLAGEEGPADELWECIHNLKVDRIDHGVSCLQDKKLLQHLKATRLPITVCPLSNYKANTISTTILHNLFIQHLPQAVHLYTLLPPLMILAACIPRDLSCCIRPAFSWSNGMQLCYAVHRASMTNKVRAECDLNKGLKCM